MSASVKRRLIRALTMRRSQRDDYHLLFREQQVVLVRLHTASRSGRGFALGITDWSHMHSKLKLAFSLTCPCGQEDQTTEHVLQRCPLDKATREDVWPVSTSLTTKLYGCKQELEKTPSGLDRVVCECQEEAEEKNPRPQRRLARWTIPTSKWRNRNQSRPSTYLSISIRTTQTHTADELRGTGKQNWLGQERFRNSRKKKKNCCWCWNQWSRKRTARVLNRLRSSTTAVGVAMLVRSLCMWPFSHRTGRDIPTSGMAHGGRVSISGIDLSRTWASGSFQSVWWNARVHKLDRGLHSILKEVGIAAPCRGQATDTSPILLASEVSID